MIVKEPLNHATRLFSFGEVIQYLHACSLWRVMFTRNTLMVKCRFNYLDEIFSIDGNDLHVSHAECRDPREYIQEDVIMRFIDCKIKRSWMIDVSIIDANKANYLTYNIEFEFSDFWIKRRVKWTSFNLT